MTVQKAVRQTAAALAKQLGAQFGALAAAKQALDFTYDILNDFKMIFQITGTYVMSIHIV